MVGSKGWGLLRRVQGTLLAVGPLGRNVLKGDFEGCIEDEDSRRIGRRSKITPKLHIKTRERGNLQKRCRGMMQTHRPLSRAHEVQGAGFEMQHVLYVDGCVRGVVYVWYIV